MIVIVTGSFRSGTSLLAGLLHNLGMPMGTDADFPPADKNNLTGYWENQKFVSHNHAIIHRAGGTTVKLPQREVVKQLIPDFRKPTANLIEEHRPLGKIWGWKDATNCIVLDHYLEYVSDEFLIVKTCRDINDIAKSAYNSWGWEMMFSIMSIFEWLERLNESLKSFDRKRIFTVCFDRLVYDTINELTRLFEFLDMPFNFSKALIAIEKFNLKRRVCR